MRSRALGLLIVTGCFVNDVTDSSSSGAANAGAGASTGPGGTGPDSAGPGGAGGSAPGGSGTITTGGGGQNGGGGAGGNPTCGDGQIQPGDECEDGNDLPNDQCDAECQFESAACNGSLEAGEVCDEGTAGSTNCPDCQFGPSSPCDGLPTYLVAAEYDSSTPNTTPFVSMGDCSALSASAPTFGFNVDVGPWPRGVVVETLAGGALTRAFASAGCQMDIACSTMQFPVVATEVLQPGSLRTFGIADPPAAFRLNFSRHVSRFTTDQDGWSLGAGFSYNGGGISGIYQGAPSEMVSQPIYVGGLETVDIRLRHETTLDGAVDVKVRAVGGEWQDAIDSLEPGMLPKTQTFTTDTLPGQTIEIGIEMKSSVTTYILGVLVVERDLL